VSKAVLLAAVLRSQKIPARLGFADVKNHLVTQRLKALMEIDLWLSSKEWTHRTAKLYEATGGVPPWEKNTSTKNSKLKL
ncbi:MAG: hypothetical protein WBR24_09610, partial [Desulfobacterales bacterium]